MTDCPQPDRNEVGTAAKDMFYAFDAATAQPIEPGFVEATEAEIDLAATQAADAREWLAQSEPARRAELLEQVADAMEARQSEIVQRCVTETGYLPERVVGEFRRATGQLRVFAKLTRERYWDQRQIAAADPKRELAPGVIVPRPEMRRRLVPVGPVAVFGACNFPLAISVVGNDFVAAIAVGCPVIVKSHPSHPGTCEILGQVVCETVERLGFPAGTFALLHGRRPETSVALVQHPAIAAVGFTGSPVGGRALAEEVLRRERPIPIFAELGSTNPVFITALALDERCESIANGFAESLRFGNGHMCTKPGVLVVPKDVCDRFVEQVVSVMVQQTPLPLLNGGVAEAFDRGTADYRSVTGVQTLYEGVVCDESERSFGPWHRGPHWYAVDASTAMENHEVHRSGLLHSETFGPVSLLVQCRDKEEMLAVAKQFHGSLTTSLHRGSDDDAFTQDWLPIAERFAGRIVYNGWPTGMEIGPATQHGGPYPASLDGNSTSVGYASLQRFVRPVCYQNWPEEQIGGC